MNRYFLVCVDAILISFVICCNKNILLPLPLILKVFNSHKKRLSSALKRLNFHDCSWVQGFLNSPAAFCLTWDRNILAYTWFMLEVPCSAISVTIKGSIWVIWVLSVIVWLGHFANKVTRSYLNSGYGVNPGWEKNSKSTIHQKQIKEGSWIWWSLNFLSSSCKNFRGSWNSRCC